MFVPKGIIPPIVIPFHADGTINYDVYRQVIGIISQGVHGIFPMGTTGEFYGVTDEEHRKLLEVTVETVNGRVDVYAGANDITGGVSASCALPGRLQALMQFPCSPPCLSPRPRRSYTTTLRPLPRAGPGYPHLCRAVLRRSGCHRLLLQCGPRLVADSYDRYQEGDLKGALGAQFKLNPLRLACSMGTFPRRHQGGVGPAGLPRGQVPGAHCRAAPGRKREAPQGSGEYGADCKLNRSTLTRPADGPRGGKHEFTQRL